VVELTVLALATLGFMTQIRAKSIHIALPKVPESITVSLGVIVVLNLHQL
jgi:hypothetical protein